MYGFVCRRVVWFRRCWWGGVRAPLHSQNFAPRPNLSQFTTNSYNQTLYYICVFDWSVPLQKLVSEFLDDKKFVTLLRNLLHKYSRRDIRPHELTQIHTYLYVRTYTHTSKLILQSLSIIIVDIFQSLPLIYVLLFLD